MEAFFIQELLTRYTPRITIKLTKFFYCFLKQTSEVAELSDTGFQTNRHNCVFLDVAMPIFFANSRQLPRGVSF